jgi:hypothetical protein
MKAFRLILFLFCFAGMALRLTASDGVAPDAHFELFRPLVGKTWSGEFKGSTPEKPVVDVSHWEWALNGKAVRQLHSINDGAYGGETIFTWDEQAQTVIYHYFTTEGYTTKGTIAFKDGKIITSEQVAGDAGGVTEVRGTSEFLPDGGFHVKAEYLKNGAWQSGHEVTYHESPSATVKFKSVQPNSSP